jgi:hypothetical protein
VTKGAFPEILVITKPSGGAKTLLILGKLDTLPVRLPEPLFWSKANVTEQIRVV